MSHLIACITGTLHGLRNMAGDIVHGITHALHCAGHAGDLAELMLRPGFQRTAGLGKVMTQLAEPACVAHHAVDKAGDLLQKLLETLRQRHAFGRTLAGLAIGRKLIGGGQHSIEHVMILDRFSLILHGQIDQNRAFYDDVHRMHHHHAPAAAVVHDVNREARMLQGVETDMVDGNGDGSDQNRQPVAVEGQHGEEDEDAEMYFDQPVRLIDMQRGHDHQAYTHTAAHQSGAADGTIQPGQHHRGAATDDDCLGEGVEPERQPERVDEQQPDQTQHDPVGLAVMVQETRGYGHRTHPFEIHGDRGPRRFSDLHEQNPGQRAI
ncbi:hypothetical protein ALQ88_200207 [Pseudomonas savastanoi]|nr:hypothetical protein ALQ88_200207 [Pseudomonas savastanoi]